MKINKEMKKTLSLGLSDWTDGTLSELENEMRNAQGTAQPLKGLCPTSNASTTATITTHLCSCSNAAK